MSSSRSRNGVPIIRPEEVPPTKSLWKEVFSKKSWAGLWVSSKGGAGQSTTSQTPIVYTPLWMFSCLLLEINLLWIALGILPKEYAVAQYLGLRVFYNVGMGLFLKGHLSLTGFVAGLDAQQQQQQEQHEQENDGKDAARRDKSSCVTVPASNMLLIIRHINKINPLALERLYSTCILDTEKIKKSNNNSSGSGGDLSKFSSLNSNVKAWLMFRAIFGPVLSLDLVAHFVMCVAYIDWWELLGSFSSPSTTSSFLVVSRFIIGLLLIFLGLWVKRSADGVLGQYGWFLGDFFFLLDRQAGAPVKKNTEGEKSDSSSDDDGGRTGGIKTNGIFSFVPHPMYTLGYSFYYGLALISQSWVVLGASLFGHIVGQLVFFLGYVEIPHMNRVYGG